MITSYWMEVSEMIVGNIATFIDMKDSIVDDKKGAVWPPRPPGQRVISSAALRWAVMMV
jgi:hypothetical protein